MTRRKLLSKRDALEILSAWISDSEICTRWLLVVEHPPRREASIVDVTQDIAPVTPG